MAISPDNKRFPTITGEVARRFLAREKYFSEVVKHNVAFIQDEESTDPFRVLEYDNFEDWYEKYYRNTLDIKPDDYNFDEEYY